MSKNDKRKQIKATVLAVAMSLMPLAAYAAGLGKITVHSALGQPLRAELEVTASKDETSSLTARVASADAFRYAGIEYTAALSTIKFSREIKERNGRRYIEMTTDRPLNEPFIDMLIELSWSAGRLVREYTFLLDPPELAVKAPPPAVAPPELKPQPAPAPAPVVQAPPPPPPMAPAPVTTPAPTPAAESVASKPPAPEADKSGEAAALKPAQRLSKTSKQLAKEKTAEKIAAEKPAEKHAADDKPKEAAKEASKAGGERKVVAGDTLGKIASQTRHDGVSFDQMVVGLFRNNQDAFDEGNMNRLKAGKILRIPDAETVSQVSNDEARKEILAQASDFNAYRKKLAEGVATAPVKEQPAKQAIAGKIAPKVEDKAPPVAAGKDKLEVSRSEVAKGAKDANGKPLQGRVTAMEEDMVAREKALKEANSRIADLEKNIQDLKKLAEMKSQAGADLQKQAQAKTSAPAEPPKPAVPAAAPATAPTPPAEAAKPADAPAVPAAPPPAPAPKPAAKPKAPPPPEPEPTFMEANGPLVIAGGGGLVAILLGWLGLSAMRKKKKVQAKQEAIGAMQAEQHHHDGVPDSAAYAAVIADSAAASTDEQETSQFSTTSSTVQATETIEPVDPLSEADTFLAFGRDAQAEEILVEALKNDPTRQAIHNKLLDIYHGRQNVSQFAAVAEKFKELVGGAGEDWERVAGMGREIDPTNALYGGVAEEAAPSFESTMVMEAPVMPEAPPEMPPVEVPAEAEAAALDFNLDAEPPAEPEAAVDSGEAAALDLDFEVQPPEPAAETEKLDMDLDTTKFEVPAPSDEVVDLPLETLEMPEPVAEPAAAAPTDAGDGNSVDFEFELKPPAAEPEPAVEVKAEEDIAALDLELPELEMPEPMAEAKPEPMAEPKSEVAELDLGELADISLELETPPAPEAAAEVVQEATPAADAADNPEVTTKLELATAYEEMGDKDGARELYEEALKEGSPAQQETARAKLAALD